MIPHQNEKNLMLRQEVVDAVKQGKFHIYAVHTIDEGMEILTGLEAGIKKNGKYPRDSINYKVDKQLKDMAVKLRRFAAPAEKKNSDKE